MTLTDRARSGTQPAALAILALLFVIPFLPVSNRSVYVLSIGMIYGIAAVGLDVFAGYAGLLAVCAFAFVGIGAYCAVIAVTHGGLEVWMGLPLAILGSALVGFVIGLPMIRLRELGVALATFFFAFAAVALFEGDLLYLWTNSSTGLAVPPLVVGGIRFSRGQGLFYLTWTVLLIVVLITCRYVNCRAGKALRLVKRSDMVAQCLGVDTLTARLSACVFFAALCGAAGFLYAQSVGFISPEVFPGLESVFVLAMVVIGGLGSVAGPILGAIGFQLLSEATRGAGGYREMALAFLLLIILVGLPEGFYGVLERTIAKVKGLFRSSVPAAQVAAAAAPATVSPQIASLPIELGGGGSALMSEPGYVLSVADVGVRFGGVIALEDISFQVPSNSIFAVLGPNGAGKTTLLNCISGVQGGTGEIRLNDTSISTLGPRQIRVRRVTRTFQHPSLVGDLSAVENVELGMYGDAPSSPITDVLPLPSTLKRDAKVRLAAERALDLVGLSRDLQQLSASNLSLAEQKLTDIARAIVSRPRLLLLDEPTAGLAESEMDSISQVLRNVHKATNVTIVVIAHHMGFIRKVADQAVVLDFGKVIARGTPDEVLRDPQVMSVFVGTGHV